jgi:cyanophycin synthetase
MVGGKLAGVLTGEPPRITGDGVHTITELVKIKNDTRPARVGETMIRDITHPYLARLGYTVDSILPMGTTIDMTEKIGLSYGGVSREDTPHVHPKLRAELERAAAVVDDPIHGFDFISPDISVDPDTVRWGIIECNSVPFINLHHDPLVGTPVNVAGILFDDLAKNV